METTKVHGSSPRRSIKRHGVKYETRTKAQGRKNPKEPQTT